MTQIVLVHGNPDIDIIWDPLARELTKAGRGDQLRLSPPGFGAPAPDGFEATPLGYRGWLVAELEALAAPVHLVGHDWGGGHVVNVAMARPDLLRSWTSATIGLFHPDYVWHDFARIWQTAPDGEQWVEEQLADPSKLAGLLVDHGMEPFVADRVASSFDAQMGACILELYRASQQPVLAELGTRLHAAAARPGLVVLPTLDQAVGSDEQRQEAAATAGARVAVLEGANHWWMTVPDQSAVVEALTTFWSDVEASG